MSSPPVSADKDVCLQVIIASTIGVSVTMLGTPGVGPSSLILGNITRPIAISLQIRLPGLAERVSFGWKKWESGRVLLLGICGNQPYGWIDLSVYLYFVVKWWRLVVDDWNNTSRNYCFNTRFASIANTNLGWDDLKQEVFQLLAMSK